MKAYVIKNKKGKYFQWLFNEEPDWEDKLYNSFMHYSKENAEKSIIQWQLEDCEVVEITIAEGDLEQQLARFNKFMEINEWSSIQEMQDTLNGCEQKYLEQQHQLAEKEKEIEGLKDFHEFEKDLMFDGISILMKEKEQEIRHQVCEEVKEKLNIEDVKQRFENSMCDGCIKIPYRTLLKILNEIEKGE